MSENSHICTQNDPPANDRPLISITRDRRRDITKRTNLCSLPRVWLLLPHFRSGFGTIPYSGVFHPGKCLLPRRLIKLTVGRQLWQNPGNDNQVKRSQCRLCSLSDPPTPKPLPKTLSILSSLSHTASSLGVFLKYLMRCCGMKSSSVDSLSVRRSGVYQSQAGLAISTRPNILDG